MLLPKDVTGMVSLEFRKIMRNRLATSVNLGKNYLDRRIIYEVIYEELDKLRDELEAQQNTSKVAPKLTPEDKDEDDFL